MPSFTVPTFLFGTSQGARSSAILRQSVGLGELPASEARVLGAFPLALAKWLRQREVDEAIGCLPLGYQPTDGRLLFHCVYLRDLGNEPIGVASGIYLGPRLLEALEYHPERLLHLVPVPSRDANAGEQPLEVSPEDFLPVSGRVVTGLEWRNIAIRIPENADPLAAMMPVLGAVSDPRLQQRVMGWATTSQFPEVGSINPEIAFQLIVSHRFPSKGGYHQLTFQDGGIVEPPVPPPPGWFSWQTVDAALVGEPVLQDACGWANIFIDLPPEAIVPRLMDRLLARSEDGGALYLQFLRQLAKAHILADPKAELRARIERADAPGKANLMAAIHDLADDQARELGITGIFTAEPVHALYLPPDHFRRLLDETEWLLSPFLKDRHLSSLDDEQLAASLSITAARLGETKGNHRAPHAAVFRRLLLEFVDNKRLSLQQGLLARGLIDELQSVRARNYLDLAPGTIYLNIRRYAYRYLSAPDDSSAREALRAQADLSLQLPSDREGMHDLLYALDTVLWKPDPGVSLATRNAG